METLLYKIIKTEKQYYEYCNIVAALAVLKKKNRLELDTIELLTVLIEKWDAEHNTFGDAEPIELLKYLMAENKLKAVDLAGILGVGKSLVSDMLHYRRGLSKEIIRKLASRFKLSQEAFNKPYKLATPVHSQPKNGSGINTKRKLSGAVQLK